MNTKWFRGIFAAVIITLCLGANLAHAQTPVKPSGVSNVWRGNWDGNEELWTIMTVRANANGVAELVFSYPRLKPYYNDKIHVVDGKAFSFTWGDSKIDFTLQSDGTLKGVRESKKHGKNEISMIATPPKTEGLDAVWEGIWGGKGDYWTVISVQTNPTKNIAEVMMTNAKGHPFYSDQVQVNGNSFTFSWGPTATFEFELSDGLLKGTQKLKGVVNTTVTLKRMFD